MIQNMFSKIFKRLTSLFSFSFEDKKDDVNGELKYYLIKGSLGSFTLRIIDILLGLISSILFARILGPKGLGAYSYVLALISIIVVPVQWGLPQFLTREVSGFKTKRKWKQLRGLVYSSNRIVLITGIFFILVLGPLTYYELLPISTLETSVFWYGLPLLVLMPLTSTKEASLRGLQEIIYGQLPKKLVKPVLLVLLTYILYLNFGSEWFSPEKVMLLVSISFAISVLVSEYFLRARTPKEVKASNAVYKTKKWLKSSTPFLLIGILSILNSKTDIVLLGLLRDADEVGIYQVAYRGANLIIFSLSAVNLALAPVVSGLWFEGKIDRLQKVIYQATFAIIGFSLPIALMLILGGSWILKVVFGAPFQIGYLTMCILSLGYLFSAFMGSVGLILNMTGFEKFTSYGIGIALITNVIFNLLFIPRWGIEGAAVASSLSLVVWNSFLGVIVYKKVGIKPSLFNHYTHS